MARNINRYKALENIANGIQAANKIKSIRQPEGEDGTRSGPNKPDISMLSQILESIAEYSPKSYRGPLGETNSKCCHYCDTYRSFKQHILAGQTRGSNKDRYVKSLNILEPILDEKKKVMISKIMKIYDLFN